ncbi:hypothetical protein MPTK2_4g18920 [Marchantia polymorpha subsp. ruderalis]
MTVQETQSQIASVALAIFFATFFTLVRKFPTVSAVCLIVVATIATNLGEAITINEALRLLTRIITITTVTDCAPLGPFVGTEALGRSSNLYRDVKT